MIGDLKVANTYIHYFTFFYENYMVEKDIRGVKNVYKSSG